MIDKGLLFSMNYHPKCVGNWVPATLPLTKNARRSRGAWAVSNPNFPTKGHWSFQHTVLAPKLHGFLRFRRIFYVPGNHDLWATAPSRPWGDLLGEGDDPTLLYRQSITRRTKTWGQNPWTESLMIVECFGCHVFRMKCTFMLLLVRKKTCKLNAKRTKSMGWAYQGETNHLVAELRWLWINSNCINQKDG